MTFDNTEKILAKSIDNSGFYGLKTLNWKLRLYGGYTKAWTYASQRSHTIFETIYNKILTFGSYKNQLEFLVKDKF